MALAVFHKQLYENRNIRKRGIGDIRIFLIELPIELPIVLPIVAVPLCVLLFLAMPRIKL